VDRIVQASPREKPIERVVTQASQSGSVGKAKETIARRVASLLQNGMYVNLGIGLPTMSIT